MKTQPIVKFHLSKLAEAYQELLKIRSSVDEHGIIAVEIFHGIEKEFKYLRELEEPSSAQVKSLEKRLIQLKHYLQQFDRYSQLSKSFFQKITSQIDSQILQSSYSYLAAKNRARQLFEDFRDGRYFDIGLQKGVDQLRHFIDLFRAKMPSLNTQVPIGDLDIFQPIRQNSDEEFDLKDYLSKQIDTSPNKISVDRIKQIKDGYYYLYSKSLAYQIQGKEHKLAKRLTLLETGLRKQNEQVIYKALRLIQQLVQPTAITSPTNYINTQQKLIKLTGISEPDSTIILRINNNRPLRVVVDQDQNFVFEDIELQFGDNTLICYNQDFLFLDNHKYHLHIHLERHYPFIGMYDPLTQKAFQENEAQIIVRCKICKNYEYDFSVEENNNRCVFPKCDGKEFWNWEDREYWSEQ